MAACIKRETRDLLQMFISNTTCNLEKILVWSIKKSTKRSVFSLHQSVAEILALQLECQRGKSCWQAGGSNSGLPQTGGQTDSTQDGPLKRQQASETDRVPACTLPANPTFNLHLKAPLDSSQTSPQHMQTQCKVRLHATQRGFYFEA